MYAIPSNSTSLTNKTASMLYPKPELPIHIQLMFSARPTLPFVKLPKNRKCRNYDPVCTFAKEIFEKFEEEVPVDVEAIETKKERHKRLHDVKQEEHGKYLEEITPKWNPHEDEKIQGDPLKTIIVARLNYETDEEKLKREFEIFGPIKRIKLIRDLEGKSRGYAFVEFVHKNDFLTAYKKSESFRIDGRKVIVDCERGRTIKGWKPRRLGGGKGNTRDAKLPQSFIIAKERAERAEEKRIAKKEEQERKRAEYLKMRAQRFNGGNRNRSEFDRGGRGNRGPHRDFDNNRDGRDDRRNVGDKRRQRDFNDNDQGGFKRQKRY